MEIKKLTEHYKIVEDMFNGEVITFRYWYNRPNEVEVLVDDNFARANGYKSVEDMAKETIGMATFQKLYGRVPEWITATSDGEFNFIGSKRTELN